MLSPEEYYGDETDGQWKPPHHMQGMQGGPPHVSHLQVMNIIIKFQASKLNTWANKRNKGGHPGAMFPTMPPPNFNGAGGMCELFCGCPLDCCAVPFNSGFCGILIA
jgi:hypothetical protein